MGEKLTLKECLSSNNNFKIGDLLIGNSYRPKYENQIAIVIRTELPNKIGNISYRTSLFWLNLSEIDNYSDIFISKMTRI